MRGPLIAAGSLPLLALLLLLIALPASAHSEDTPTVLSGVIDTPTTLDDPNGYLVQGPLSVTSQLAIQPGIVLTIRDGRLAARRRSRRAECCQHVRRIPHPLCGWGQVAWHQNRGRHRT